MSHAVEQGQNHGVRTHGRRERGDCIVEGVGLAAQHNQIEGHGDGLCLHGLHITQRKVAPSALDDKTRAPQLFRPSRPHQKSHVTSRCCQPSAKVAPYRACTYD